MHRQTQNHIYAILINSFLLLFHGKKKEKKRRNMFTIFLQTNFYPKKKMASVALWTHVVKYCSKRFLEDCWNTFLWIYLLIMTKYWLSCVFFPTSQRWHSNFFATKGVALGLAVTCQPYRCLHTGSCQFSSLGGVPVGKRKKQRNRYPTCTWIFPPRKANRSSFFLVKKHFPNENQLVLDHLCFPPLEIVCSCVLLSSPWSEVISPLLRMGMK